MIYMEHQIKQRYYLLFIEQDLFKTWCLVKSFGSLISRRGRTMVEVCLNKQDASEKLFDVENKKRQRGYNYADLPQVDRYHLRPQTIKELMDKINNNKMLKQPQATAQAEIHQTNPNQLELF